MPEYLQQALKQNKLVLQFLKLKILTYLNKLRSLTQIIHNHIRNMFTSKYFSLPINQDFQPIKIQLENYEQKKHIDFKLIVLLILIIMLGILIRKEEEQLQIQTAINDEIQYLRREISQTQYIQQTTHESQVTQTKDLLLMNSIVNSQQEVQKQIAIINKESQKNNPMLTHVAYSQPSSGRNQQHKQQPLPGSGNQDILNNYKSTHIIQRSQSLQEQLQYKNINSHSQVLKKYREFYLWFPLFIFALIVYSCYEKLTSSQTSLLISVKTFNQYSEEQEVGECAICINEISGNQPLAVLPCSKKHIFHSRCIKEWLPQKKTCPICRYDVRKFGNLQR